MAAQKNKKNSTKISAFYKIPKDYIYEVDEQELLTYIGILKFRLYEQPNVAFLSQKSLCAMVGYRNDDRRKGSYFSSIKKHFCLFVGRKWIELDGCEKINPSECIEIKISDSYIPNEDFVKLSVDDFQTIVNNKLYNSKAALLKVYLYVKSLMFVDHNHPENTISAYYVVRKIAANTLKMSLPKYDRCLETLCGLGLLVCHQTGSYYTYHGIVNAPNIYVLNNAEAQSNISGALNRLKHNLLDTRFGNHDTFMPVVCGQQKLENAENMKLREELCNEDWGDLDECSLFED